VDPVTPMSAATASRGIAMIVQPTILTVSLGLAVAIARRKSSSIRRTTQTDTRADFQSRNKSIWCPDGLLERAREPEQLQTMNN
jgi:hypothetical protein